MFSSGVASPTLGGEGIESSWWERKSTWEEGKGMGRGKERGSEEGKGKGKGRRKKERE